jgi:integrase
MKLTPEAGSIKTNTYRDVPLHGDLIAQGFLDFVAARGKGPLFYNVEEGKPDAGDVTNPRRPRAVKTRERLAAWVRELGITDKEVSPTHSWRHTFKQVAERSGISERISDTITGHAPTTAGRGYGKPTVEDMAAALKKFPRYKV